MRQEKVSVGIMMNVENEELSTWNRKVLGEGVRNIDEIWFPGTLRRERLERGQMATINGAYASRWDARFVLRNGRNCDEVFGCC